MIAAGSPAVDTFDPVLRRVRKNGMAGSKRKRRRSRDENRRRFEEAADLYLEDCYARQRPVSVKEFAAGYLEATQPYLSRIAPQLIGTSIGNFLRSRQLAHAEELLRRTPAKVTVLQIAMASGFGTPWTFTRWFRVAYGTTPAKYRARMAERGARRRR
ncbi:MAG: helix-turn-helix domain-containing protein [Acidobacteriota bacterium]